MKKEKPREKKTESAQKSYQKLGGTKMLLKSKNRLFALLLAMVIALLCFAGCTGGGTATDAATSTDAAADSTDTAAATDTSTGDRIKIGVSIWGYTDALGKDVYDFLTYVSAAIDCDVEFVAQNFDTEATISSIENLITSGCDAIIVCNSSDGVMPKILKLCEDNEVYVAQFFRVISDPEVLEYANSCKYFLGCTHEDEVSTGYNLGKALADKGIENTAIVSWNHGDPTAEDRYTGYMKAFEEFNIQVLAEQWEINAAEEGAKAAENFIAAYPELQSIVVTGGSGEPLAGTLSAIENRNMVGNIHVVSTDFLPTLRDDMDTGKISAMSGGHWADPFFSFMLAYNVASGGWQLDEPTEIVMDMVYVASVEDVDNYEKWFMGEIPPYTTEEIQALCVSTNPSVTLDDLKAAASTLSLEDVMARHQDMM